MVQELTHPVDSLLARRASRYDIAFSALRDRWRFVNEVEKNRDENWHGSSNQLWTSWNILQGALA